MNDKAITIITTVHPAKKNKRAVTVSAAPEGEMPLVLTGQFSERHTLADQAFAALLNRKPQTVKVAASSSKSKKAAPKKGDQLVASAEAETSAPPAEELPVIEGDDPAAEPVEDEAPEQEQLSLLGED